MNLVQAAMAGAGDDMAIFVPEAGDDDVSAARKTAHLSDSQYPCIAFQPIVNARSRRIFGYEALVRGINGEPAGAVLASIPHGDRQLFEMLCCVAAIRMAARLGVISAGAYLAINLAPDAGAVGRRHLSAIMTAARYWAFPTDRLIFEFTEGSWIDDVQAVRELFSQYCDHGLVTAIDDFGAGYSGLVRLIDLQPRLLKIDRALLHGIDGSQTRRSIVRCIVAMSQEMGVPIIAEGVETAAECATLMDLGIALFQGFYFAHPAREQLPLVHWI